MTIDDELIYELIKPDRYGKVGKGALIVKIVRTLKIDYKLEESTYYPRLQIEPILGEPETEFVKITPDITVTLLNEKRKQVAIELENDIQWDFGQSLRQVKKYKEKFPDTRVIIPYKYERFAPLYKNEGFRVWLWQTKRKWQCLRCGHINLNESRIPPKCKGKKCNNTSRNEFDLIGLENADINEYQ